MKLNTIISDLKNIFLPSDEVLNASNAQSLGYFGKEYQYRNMLEKFTKNIDENIRYRAKNFHCYAIIEIPEWLKKEDSKRIVNIYKEKGFTITEITNSKFNLLIMAW